MGGKWRNGSRVGREMRYKCNLESREESREREIQHSSTSCQLCESVKVRLMANKSRQLEAAAAAAAGDDAKVDMQNQWRTIDFHVALFESIFVFRPPNVLNEIN